MEAWRTVPRISFLCCAVVSQAGQGRHSPDMKWGRAEHPLLKHLLPTDDTALHKALPAPQQGKYELTGKQDSLHLLTSGSVCCASQNEHRIACRSQEHLRTSAKAKCSQKSAWLWLQDSPAASQPASSSPLPGQALPGALFFAFCLSWTFMGDNSCHSSQLVTALGMDSHGKAKQLRSWIERNNYWGVDRSS